MKGFDELRRLARLWPWCRPDRGIFLFALLISPLALGAGLVQPWLLKQAVDQHITRGDLEGLPRVAGLYLAAALGAYLFELAFNMALTIAGQRTILRLRASIYEHLLGLAPAWFDKRPVGELMTRATSDVEALGESLTSGVLTIVLDVLVVLGVLGVMFAMEWRLTLVLLALAPPLLLVIELCRRQLKKAYDLTRESLSAVNTFLAEQVSGMEIVQLFGQEERSTRRFVELNTPYREATVTSNVYDALMYAAVDGASSIFVAVMVGYGAWELSGGLVSAGLLVAFVDYLDRLFKPLRNFSGKVVVIQRSDTALDRIFRLLDDALVVPEGPRALGQVEGRIQVKDLRFGYKPDLDVLHGIDLEMRPGEVVALVGPSGCGKTTLTRVLHRDYEGYRGSVTLDGVEIRDLRKADLRRAMVAVRQDIQLFPDSLRFNVDLGDPAIGAEAVERAAELVHFAPIARRLGWSAKLTDRGGNLSVGEGQLLTYARAMAHDPAVVILDEATASVDPVTERLIQDATARILEQKTVIVVAHRLSTIISADQIVVMKEGRVAERGTHAELLAKGGIYAELYAAGFEEG